MVFWLWVYFTAFLAGMLLGFFTLGIFGMEISLVSIGVFAGPTRLIMDDLGCRIESRPTRISGDPILSVALDDLGSALALSPAGLAGVLGGFTFIGFLGL